MGEAGVNPHLAEMVLESHQGSWFGINGASSIAATERGVLPGDYFADIVFDFLMTNILKRVEVALEREGLGVSLEWDGVRAPIRSPWRLGHRALRQLR